MKKTIHTYRTEALATGQMTTVDRCFHTMREPMIQSHLCLPTVLTTTHSFLLILGDSGFLLCKSGTEEPTQALKALLVLSQFHGYQGSTWGCPSMIPHSWQMTSPSLFLDRNVPADIFYATFSVQVMYTYCTLLT